MQSPELDDLQDDIEAVLGHLTDIVDLLSQCILPYAASRHRIHTAGPFDTLRQSLADYAEKTPGALQKADDHAVTGGSVSDLIKLSGLSATVVMLLDLVNKLVDEPQLSSDYAAVRETLIAACKGRDDVAAFTAISANSRLPELGRRILAYHQVALSLTYFSSLSSSTPPTQAYREACESLYDSLLPDGATWPGSPERSLNLLDDILGHLPEYTVADKAKVAGISEDELLSRGITRKKDRRAESLIIVKMWHDISVIPSFQFNPSGEDLELTPQIASILRVTVSGEMAESAAPNRVERNGFDGWPLALWAWNHRDDTIEDIERKLADTPYWWHTKDRNYCDHEDGVAKRCTGWNASGVPDDRRKSANATVIRASMIALAAKVQPRYWFNMSSVYYMEKDRPTARETLPFFFGNARPASRFELPESDGDLRDGTMYLADHPLGCLGEVLWHRPIIMLPELQEYVVRRLRCDAPLSVMDLSQLLPYDSLCDAERIVTHEIARKNHEAQQAGIQYSLRRVLGGTGLALHGASGAHESIPGWTVSSNDPPVPLLEMPDFWMRYFVDPETLPDMLLLPYPSSLDVTDLERIL